MRQYRAAHDVVRGLIEARLMRTELPLAAEQREALTEQLQLSSAASRDTQVRPHRRPPAASPAASPPPPPPPPPAAAGRPPAGPGPLGGL